MTAPLTEVVRAGEWWEYKLVPIFAAFYATALTLRAPLAPLWLTLVTVLLALVPGAAYVSVINDWTDRADDLAAGKSNRLAGRSPAYGAMLVALTIAPGLVFSYLWRHDTLLLSFYLCAWLAFSLYSLPPFRLKSRGLPGVLADASGAHLFPTLVAVVLAFRACGRPASAAWLVAVGTWALTNGLRGILWHQLSDLENDRHAGVRTFAVMHPTLATRLGTFIIFPLELLALAAILWQIQSPWPAAALLVYLLLAGCRLYRWPIRLVIVTPQTAFHIALHEYYDLFLPASILIASAIEHPWDWLVLAIHLALFSGRLRQASYDVRELWRWRNYPRARA